MRVIRAAKPTPEPIRDTKPLVLTKAFGERVRAASKQSSAEEGFAFDIMSAREEFTPEQIRLISEAYQQFHADVDDIWKIDAVSMEDQKSRRRHVHQLREELTAKEITILGSAEKVSRFEEEFTRIKNDTGAIGAEKTAERYAPDRALPPRSPEQLIQ